MMKARRLGRWGLLFFLCVPIGLIAGSRTEIKEVCYAYIQTWKKFYPSQAISRGFLDSVFNYEDYSQECIVDWLDFNHNALSLISRQESKLDIDDRIDARLLRIQIQSEIDRWEKEAPHKNSPALYSGSISRAVRGVLD